MLAKPTADMPSGSGWLYEFKLDGYRTLVMKKGGRITMFSRRGNVVNARYPKMPPAFMFLPEDTIVDGELVVLDAQGRPSFSALQHTQGAVKSLYFYVFDLLALEGTDLRKLAFTDRRRLLEEYVLRGMSDPVRLSIVFIDRQSS